MIVDLAMSTADSFATGAMKVNDAELFNQRVRNLLEIPHDSGV